MLISKYRVISPLMSIQDEKDSHVGTVMSVTDM